MPRLRYALVAGVAALGVAGTVALTCRADARDAPAGTHVVQLVLPDGSVARIRYAGDVPPQIAVAPAPLSFAPAAMTDLAWPPGFTLAPGPFEALLHMQAAMDAQARAILRAAALPDAPGWPGGGPGGGPGGAWPGVAWPGGPVLAAMADPGALPPGMQGERVVTTVTGHGVCTRTTRFAVPAAGGPAQAVTHVSGDCSPFAAPGGALPVARPDPAPAPAQPRMYRARATVPAGGAHLVQVADWQH